MRPLIENIGSDLLGKVSQFVNWGTDAVEGSIIFNSTSHGNNIFDGGDHASPDSNWLVKPKHIPLKEILDSHQMGRPLPLMWV